MLTWAWLDVVVMAVGGRCRRTRCAVLVQLQQAAGATDVPHPHLPGGTGGVQGHIKDLSKALGHDERNKTGGNIERNVAPSLLNLGLE